MKMSLLKANRKAHKFYQLSQRDDQGLDTKQNINTIKHDPRMARPTKHPVPIKHVNMQRKGSLLSSGRSTEVHTLPKSKTKITWHKERKKIQMNQYQCS